MTPKEKAQELFNKFALGGWGKENALRCVDEILDIVVGIYDYDYQVLYPYWTEVKEEIQKL
jgi:hypothetical protein